MSEQELYVFRDRMRGLLTRSLEYMAAAKGVGDKQADEDAAKGRFVVRLLRDGAALIDDILAASEAKNGQSNGRAVKT